MKDVFLEVYKSLSSELDFKVAWFDLLMINDYSFLEFCLVLLYFLVCIVQSDALREKGKYSDS